MKNDLVQIVHIWAYIATGQRKKKRGKDSLVHIWVITPSKLPIS